MHLHMWTDDGDLTLTMVPDLDKYNLSIVEWLEEVIEEYPRCNFLSTDAFEEEDDHWTDIARKLTDKQLKELEERIFVLGEIHARLREFHDKTNPKYCTKNERHNYVERRTKEGVGKWQAKSEAERGNLVPPKSDLYTTPLHRQPFDIHPRSKWDS